MASTKKKRVSKKTKASWRKHTDIQDVEDFLEEQRAQERIGTFSEKKDEDLFEIDVQSSATPKKKQGLTEKQRRKANALKPLKCLSALENTSKVQDPIAKRNHVKLKKNGRNIEEEILNPKTQKQIQANKDRAKYNDRLDRKLSTKKITREFSKDIWKEEDVRDREPELKNTWVTKDLALYTLKNIGKGTIKVHDSVRHKTTKAKKFEPPHPGISYNPSLKDHQDLINTVVNKEEDIIKVEKHLKRVTTDMFKKVTPEEREQNRLKEMSSGLPGEDDDEEDNDNENGVEKPYQPINAPVENKKKSKQARRKQKEQKVLSNEMRKKKELKKQAADIHRIKKLKMEVEEEAEKLNQLKKHRKLVAKKKKFETKRLGRLKFQEPDVDVQMPEDISGALRTVKVESSLLVDRFKNFQKRNILPVSVKVGKRKPRKVKRFTRSSHKEPGVSIFKQKKK